MKGVIALRDWLKNLRGDKSDADGVCALAATDGANGAVMLSNFNNEPKTVTLHISGMSANNKKSSPQNVVADVNLLNEEHNLDTVKTEIFYGNNQLIHIALDKYAVALITLK